MDEKEALKLMERVVNKTLPTVLEQSFKNIRTGTITGITNSTTAEVALDNGTRISGVKIYRNATINIGDKCVIISINSFTSGSNYIVGVY